MYDNSIMKGVSGSITDAEFLLRQEIAFWREYIRICQSRTHQTVPKTAFDALQLAEEKLTQCLVSLDGNAELNQILH